MFSCEQVIEELSNYLDAEVSDEVRLELERHLAECRSCQVLYDSVRKTLRVVTESAAIELPEELSSRLISRIMAAARRHES